MRLPSFQGQDVRDRSTRLNQELLSSLEKVKLSQDKTGWYRGLSQIQMKAAQSVSECLRDDIDQNTASSVTKVLKRMGFNPIPAWDTLRLLIQLSQGNDLAFLWFLMELCYKSPNHGSSYNINEQIIMSSIFWLDLNPTLKELDRWLPLPHASQADRDKAEAIRQRRLRIKRERKEERQRELAKRAKHQGPLAMYFQEQEPNLGNRMRNSSSLLSGHPSRPAFLFQLKDSKPIPSSSMHSRWFGSYTLSTAKRVVRSIVTEEINSIFKSFEAASLPPADVESLCTHHQKIREMEKSLKIKLDLLKKKRCEELLMSKNGAEQRRRKLVIQELEEMSAAYLKRFRDLAARSRLATTRKHLFAGGNYFPKGYPFLIPETYKCDQMRDEKCMGEVETDPITLPLRRRSRRRSSNRNRSKGGAERKVRSRSRSRSRSNSSSKSKSRSKSISRSSSKSRGHSRKTIPPPKLKSDFRDIMVKLLKGDRPVVPNCPDFQLEPPECAKCHTYDPDFDALESKSRTMKDRRPSSLMQFLHLCGSVEDVGRDHGSNWNQDPSLHPGHDRKLVELGPPGSNTVKFNYRDLFGSLYRTRSDEERMRLKEAFVKAIDDDVQYLSAALSGEEMEGSIDTLVDKAAKRVFAEDVKTFHKELKKMQQRKAAEKAARGSHRLHFGQEFYDSDNLPLMKEMLRLGLRQVAKDKRYVLPTLPNVHAAPYLIEWICQRYGKRYSRRERYESFRESKVIIDKMMALMRGT
ncbi:uncharacterized protein LOC110186641 [Drosophila serrata]|uniref:uncharacterized protein LOC110186641 n=1 Tax=Drosophila serrata TaxID=7274 RepID=UPI000A1D0991|nr:uncharacterized protein LOC110186641 [Drosophila serrata]